MKKYLMLLGVLAVMWLLLASCSMMEPETEAEYQARRTATQFARNQVIVEGIVAQTQQAEELAATQMAARATEAAFYAQQTATEEARLQRTADYHAQQTAQAQQLTATAEERQAQQTAQAWAATATQAVKDDAVKGTATASYLGVIEQQNRATQTALVQQQKSEEQRRENERRADEATLWFRTWTPRVVWLLVGLGTVALLVYLVIWSWPWIMARLSAHREHGKLVFVFPQRDGWAALIPTLSGQPGAIVPDEQAGGRAITTSGGFVDATLQSDVAARSQAGDIVRALAAGEHGAGSEVNRKAMVRRLMQQGGPERGQEQPQTNGFRILGGAGELPAHLRPDVDTLRALDGEWREVHDDQQ